ncbi:MAG: bifunctional phosphoribosyl-AMP cyclohydrolase/phosphoribosyl-ATP diphosphatase HisIE [Armatimonadota bacterium]|nr:bifunctional phosphoribosyl-AMP cyclohydrolase/phosphoribosyl-ATP diphosphatase HisIE [Armatimonadota bacterium]MDR7454849.1 bifunctional phosphoribosyl-AMP cyclohydrolase/phosphoribosyl-ATP diphosphatase HisIE [Armatimonadota bacterium]MDR7456648.1 bifunctional phosphoribosyl-AMP cyclohydrolase/phosphoribosyl-ATP diphosphatase HisIE [Armatimonadota bacterium]MDR7495542.1 bifunctional phosphoribosyl-AMP cyclohydrolase/phosphoribosyl-ATP diphosphatase HisIE [Armatimonadota bacterium]MDR751071
MSETPMLDWTSGLVPAIVQDARTGVVLTLAWMNREAFDRTLRTREIWLWSRSRRALWRKGETSGHTQRVTDVRLDCDGDAVLVQVVPAGPACHTGRPSCFHRDAAGAETDTAGPVLARLEATIAARARGAPPGSYTAALLRGGVRAAGAKVVEEAGEVVRAAQQESDTRVAEEAADVLYHLMVLLAARGIPLTAALDVLAARAAARSARPGEEGLAAEK